MNTLQLEQINVQFGALQALSAFQLELTASEVVMLVGPNGAGKSTLLKVLLGLVSPQQGRILVDGKVRQVDNSFKEMLGYLPESVAFSDNLTGRQVLRFFAQARAVPKARIDQVLERVGLSDAGNRAVRGYSRGMRQRLGLGVAILAEPQLLILDEPTGGLDLEGLSVLWSVLQEWREEGRIVLLSTHDLALLENRIDRMCVLRSGQVVAVGTPDSLRREVALPVQVTLKLRTGHDAAIPSMMESLEQWGQGQISLHNAEIRVAIAPEHLLSLLSLQCQYLGLIENVRILEPTLNEIYERMLKGGSRG